MDLEAYMNFDPQIRMLNRSVNANMLNNKNQSEIIKLQKRGNFLLRQELNDYTPECTIKFIIIYHITFGLLCLCFAIPNILPHVYYEIQYDQCHIKEYKDNKGNLIRYCNVNVTIDEDLSPPIFLYYKLDNFFMNHREYVKSKLYLQLRGEEVKDSMYSSNCDKLKYNKDLFGTDAKSLVSFTNKPLDPEGYLNPCGLIPASFFNDSFALMNAENNLVFINETDIAFITDKKYMFKRNDNPDLQWIDVENEHFIVWMNMELFPNFIKKWGHIDTGLLKGDYTMKISWHWDSKGIETGKYFILSEGHVLGTEPLFGYVLLIGTILSLIMITIMSVKGCQSVKKFDPNIMTWD